MFAGFIISNNEKLNFANAFASDIHGIFHNCCHLIVAAKITKTLPRLAKAFKIANLTHKFKSLFKRLIQTLFTLVILITLTN